MEVLNWTNRPLADSQSNLRPPLLDFELSDCPFLNSFSLLSGKNVVALTHEGVGRIASKLFRHPFTRDGAREGRDIIAAMAVVFGVGMALTTSAARAQTDAV